MTVHGKRGEVSLDKTANRVEAKKPNAAKRVAMKVVNGLGHAWNAAVDWTESSLGIDDDTGKRKEGEAAR